VVCAIVAILISQAASRFKQGQCTHFVLLRKGSANDLTKKDYSDFVQNLFRHVDGQRRGRCEPRLPGESPACDAAQ